MRTPLPERLSPGTLNILGITLGSLCLLTGSGAAPVRASEPSPPRTEITLPSPSGCTDDLAPLTATAQASVVSGNAPLTVSFTGSASGGEPPYSYFWEFGDGTTSAAQSTRHRYPSPGNYNAVLTVSDAAYDKAVDYGISIAVTGWLPGLCPSSSDPNQWRSLGPLGSAMDALAMDPFSDSPIFYMGCSWGGGIYRTSFDGTVWQAPPCGISEDHPTAILPDPTHAGRIFASTLRGGVWRTTDGGAHWTCLTCGGSAFLSCRGLIMDPSDPDHLIAYGRKTADDPLMCGGSWVSVTDGGYIETFDGGGSWNYVDIEAGALVYTMAMDPVHPEKMYAIINGGGTKNMAGTTDGGSHWETFKTQPFMHPNRLTVSPADGSVFASQEPFYRSVDGGKNWTEVPLEGDGCCMEGILFSKNIPGQVWAGGLNLFLSTDNGGHFTQMNQWAGAPPYDTDEYHADIRSIVEDTVRKDALYIGTDGGLFKVRPTGEWYQWQEMGKPCYTYRLAIDPQNPDRILVSMQDTNGYYTVDGGATWGVTSCPESGKFLIDPEDPATRYYSAGSIIRKDTDGDYFFDQASNNGLPYVISRSQLAFDMNPYDPSNLVIGGGSGPYSTTDGGTQWLPGTISLAYGIQVYDLAASPASGGLFYLLAVDGLNTRSEIHRSSDGGATWTKQGQNLPPFQRIAADPFAPETLYATDWQRCGSDGLYISTDGGTTFAHRPGPPIGPGIDHGFDHSLAIWPDRGKTGGLYMSTGRGIARTTDYGNHWSGFSEGLIATCVTDIAQDPTNPRVLYAATYGQGVVKRTRPLVLPEMAVDHFSDVMLGVHPLTVTFSPSANGGAEPFTYEWDFGDGSPAETVANPVHVYTRSGVYYATLALTDGTGLTSWSRPLPITVADPIPVVAAPSVSHGAVPLAVHFAADPGGGTPPFSYRWEFGDGSPASSDPAPNHTYVAAGVYPWSVTVKDTYDLTGTASGTIAATGDCAVVCETLVSGSAQTGVPAAFWSTIHATACAGAPAVLWNFGDGSVSSDPSASHTYSLPGTYSWTLAASADGILCTEGGTISVSERTLCGLACEASPSADSGKAPLTVSFAAQAEPSQCQGTASFSWSFGDGTFSTEKSPVHTFTGAGEYTWILSASSDGVTCSRSGSITVTPGLPGDCDGDGSVSIGEVQKAINMFLGIAQAGVPAFAQAGAPAFAQAGAPVPPECGVDCNGDGAVSIGEVQKVINGFLGNPVSC